MTADIGRETCWRTLDAHAQRLRDVHLRELFARDATRAERFTGEACGLFMDWSKQRVDDAVMADLHALARACDVSGWRARLFAGEAVNHTEGRAALHMALRHRGAGAFPSPACDVMPAVRDVLARMAAFCARVHAGEWRGFDGRTMTDVVNIGIGGSDLGPRMAATALADFADRGLRAHFVSNLDSTQLCRLLATLDPATTLFVVASKTFSTQETLSNARSARAWLVAGAGGDERAVARHFVAVSTQLERTAAFGIDAANVFGFWDWVGGRYSLWSAIGLPLALHVGMTNFEALLAGAAAMDEHFLHAEPARNLPLTLALLGVWNRDLLAAPTHAVLPYDYALADFPAYLQQLEMESNGKRVARDGSPVTHDTCPVVWGGPGNNGQHAFYQLLHQGTQTVPSDFILAARLQHALPGHETAVLAHALAQTEALLRGRNACEARVELAGAGLSGEALEAAVPHRVMPGNQPSTTLLYERLTPALLGALIALYEHKVFVQSVIWGNNPFDQFGVELGKRLAGVIERELDADAEPAPDAHDASTLALIGRLRRLRR